MTVNSAAIGADWFLNGLGNLQTRELQTQQQLSSGFAVTTAADDPAATHALVDLGSSLATAQTYQSNLGSVQAEASAADTALGSAITLVQSAQSLGTRAASSTATADERQSFAVQVQAIQQQIVGLANTNVAGRYIFGGDEDQSAPYQYNAQSATGVDALTTASSTRTIVNPSGQPVFQSLTAGAIFDSSTASGVPAATNTFAALAEPGDGASGERLGGDCDFALFAAKRFVVAQPAASLLWFRRTAVDGRAEQRCQPDHLDSNEHIKHPGRECCRGRHRSDPGIDQPAGGTGRSG